MSFYKKLILSAFAVILVMATFVSCEDELNTLGTGVISGEPFATDKAVFNVYAYNKKIEAVQTNGLPIYQLGTFNDAIYGKTIAYVNTQLGLSSVGPVFGISTQSKEDGADTDDSVTVIKENETVKEALLYIPYLRKSDIERDSDNDGVDDAYDADPTDASSDTDGDGLTDIQEKSLGTNPLSNDTDGDGVLDKDDTDFVKNAYAKQYELDSIYGNTSEPFNLVVKRSTYFLRDVDPESNFEEKQVYYSNQEFSPTFVSDVLYNGEVIISNVDRIIYKNDDPETEDKDESKEVKTRLLPGIMVKLDTQFFQDNILDKEGSSELLSQINFENFIRGIHISATGITEDIMLLLDFNEAKIDITYEYDKVNTHGTATDTSDDTTEKAESVFSLSINAKALNTVNVFINEDYPADINSKMNTGENADRIYVKGGAGSFAEIKLFDEVNGREIINQIKANNWIINEANLVFHIDRNTLDAAGGTIEPSRLYLYNSETNLPLYFPQSDPADVETPLGVLPNYDGVIQKSNNKGDKYKIRITEYLNNIIVRDSANATLRLSLTSDIRLTNITGAVIEGNNDAKYPKYSVINPLGTVLFGSNVSTENEDKKLKLEISYSKTN